MQLCLKAQKLIYGWIAQLVEQETENLRVGGSIPSLPTKVLSVVKVGKEV